ncbi:MAG TPA: phosphonate ABC transporter, permease protein PhnE [Planctomycetota bacterium]|nr:phosphonate ABC transporter, permease protein PhnE [Planctomycetota bacterium]
MSPPTAVPAYDAPLREEASRWRRRLGGAALVLLLVLACAGGTGLLDARRMLQGTPSIVRLAGEMMPPDFRNAADWIKPLFQTLIMSVAGTALALILSLPLGCLAASNVAPHRAVYWGARGVLNALRGIPELILGIFFVAAVGFGVLPGVLALGLHSAGMVGKFFAEAMEHVDPGPVEAVRSTGASRLQVVAHGILPQILPQMADVAVYRWEFNVRASTVMGIVGAGGIGFELIASLRLMQYREVGAILLVVLGMVCLIDGLSGLLRRRFR